VQGSDVAAMLWEEAEDDDEDDDDDDDEGTRPVAEPVGDAELLADLGTPGSELVDLCAEEGLLPADVLTTVCERAGCADVLEELREG
jgi:putative tRNA adenosine deaminase-associated protein